LTVAGLLRHFTIEVGLIWKGADEVFPAERLRDPIQGDIGELPAIGKVLHMSFPLEIERGIDRIAAPVEIEGLQPEPFAKLDIEGRGRLDPGPAQVDGRVSVPEEDVGPHLLAHTGSGEVVPHVGETEAGRNPQGPAAGRQQDRLGNAPAAIDLQRGARPEPFDRQIDGIGIVSDAVPNGIIETDRLLPRIGGIAGVLSCKSCDSPTVTIDRQGGLKIGPHL